MAAGAYDDDESSDDIFDLDDVYRLETKESVMATDPGFAADVKEHDTAVLNENVYNWLRNVPSVPIY